jgi:hypothetical protein
LLHPEVSPNRTHSANTANNKGHPYVFFSNLILSSLSWLNVDFSFHISGSKKQNTYVRGTLLIAARWVRLSNQAGLLAFIMASAPIGVSSEIKSSPLLIMLYSYSAPITAGIGCWNGFLTSC